MNAFHHCALAKQCNVTQSRTRMVKINTKSIRNLHSKVTAFKPRLSHSPHSANTIQQNHSLVFAYQLVYRGTLVAYHFASDKESNCTCCEQPLYLCDSTYCTVQTLQSFLQRSLQCSWNMFSLDEYHSLFGRIQSILGIFDQYSIHYICTSE